MNQNTGGVAYDTVEAIRRWPVNDDGWHIDPKTGRWVKIDKWVKIGAWVKIGDLVKIGDEVKIGDGVTLGDEVKIGHAVTLGDGVTLGDEVKIGAWVKIGDLVKIGDGINIPSTRIAGYIANPYAPGVICIGCEIHTVEEWRYNGAEIRKKHDINPDLEPAMMKHLEWLAGWFDAYPDAMTLKEANNE
jgi:UDP-3-O-[3-hydroxymyristoyl] glucosamine N-acyltransferase